MPKIDLSDAFAIVVEQHRKNLGLSMNELASKAGLHQTYIGKMTKGKSTPSLNTAKSIADVLDISLSELIAEAELLFKKRRTNS